MSEKNEKLLVSMTFGSAVYGCSVPTSDTDQKGVFIPDDRDLVLGVAPTTRSFHSNTSKNTKNTKDDVDREEFSLSRYLDLLSQGQVVAWDILYTPSSFYLGKPREEWMDLLKHKDRFLHKKIGSFVGYAKAQAHRYSLRGDRMLALEWVISLLDNYPSHAKLYEVPIGTWSAGDEKFWEFIKVLTTGAGSFLEVCGKQVGMSASIKYVRDIYIGAHHDYGARAKAAATNGADWKALYHAYRISEEAKELLLTGHITFPRPEAPLLLQIRQGELQYEQVSDMLAQGVEEIFEAQKKSALPEEPDRAFMREFIYKHYFNKIVIDHTHDDQRWRTW